MRHTQIFQPTEKNTKIDPHFISPKELSGKILVLGDIHAEFGALNALLHKMARKGVPAVVLQVGDFGYFPNEVFGGRHGARHHKSLDPRNRLKLPDGFDLRWIDGNHEDHRAIQELVQTHGHRDPVEVAERCFYQPRGSWMTLGDGRIVLFLGGAFSVDHVLRDDHCGEIELLEEGVLARIPDDLHVDIVVSHTAPTEILHQVQAQLPPFPECWDGTPDPSCEVLQKVFEKYKPTRWFFGHFHQFAQGETRGCKWVSLNDLARLTKYFMWLD